MPYMFYGVYYTHSIYLLTWNCIIKERGTYADLSATGAKDRTGCRAESPSLPNPVEYVLILVEN